MTSYATANEATTTKKDGSPPANPVVAVAVPVAAAVANHNAESLPITQQQQQQQQQHQQQQQQQIASYGTHAQQPGTAVDTLTKFAVLPMHDEIAITRTHRYNDYCMDYDNDDSLSDGREKADTTPENIKKIADDDDEDNDDNNYEDDIIAQSSFYHHDRIASAPPTSTHPVFQKVGSNYGTATAHESRTKNNSLAKPAVTPLSTPQCGVKDPSCKRQETDNRSSSSANDNNFNDFVNNCGALNADEDGDSSASNSITTTTTTTSAINNYKQAFAFTIDSFDEKESDPATQAAKYKIMLQRFRNRHRRGASLSKLENTDVVKDHVVGNIVSTDTPQTPANVTQKQRRSPVRSQINRSAPPLAMPRNAVAETSESSTANQKVKMRARERSTSRVKDATKRHSWSPRSSMQEPSATQPPQQQPQKQQKQQHQQQKPSVPPRKTSTNLTKPPAPQPPDQQSKSGQNMRFTPRSTAMQMALKNIDYLCPQPPLADNKAMDLDMDNVSEAGTYTVEGDNYTEEQKDQMNIDTSRSRKPQHQRPKDLQIYKVSDSKETFEAPCHNNILVQRTNNVLEINYVDLTEEEPPERAAGDAVAERKKSSSSSYLQKIKNRVIRNICSAKTGPAPVEVEMESSDADVGCFTSVTTSGVLAKQSALDPCPKMARAASLSTSQIDSSEFVSNESKLKTRSAAAYAAGGFTDHQKSEYRLNVFTNQKEAHKFAETRRLIETPPQTPESCLPPAKHPETEVLKTAEFRQDWVKEWARNVRARSLANEARRNTNKLHDTQQELMTRSYTASSESAADEAAITEEALCAKLNKTLAQRYHAAHGVGECDFSSEPSLATSPTFKPSKVPSPSKIPSPLQTIARLRSSAKNAFPQDEDGDFYLQKTAAAINNIQQSLSRRNSMKSPTLSASPRGAQTGRAALYSPPEDRSPQHSLESHGYYSSPQHRRYLGNQPLMTSSINEQQLHMLTSGEYLSRQMSDRKNSYDGGPFQRNSPIRRTIAKYETQASIREREQQQQQQEEVLSPLRRSSSFSAKVALQRKVTARPNYQNIYTPPAARHQYTLATPTGAAPQLPIKKSASSNTFCQDDERFADIDDGKISYYINDQDEEEYYSSDLGDDDEQNYARNVVENTSTAASYANARYNKALLMRIEKNKPKVPSVRHSAPSQTSGSASSASASAGVAACPNTPELPRRNIKSAPRASVRQSMPRDTSLNRLATQVPQSLASAKKQLLQTAATAPRNTSVPRVQPKYLDISKYKPAQGNNFLRKNDTKSTLRTPAVVDPLKRSPSASAALQRADPTRTSNRSTRSITSSGMCSSITSQSGGGGGGVGLYNSRAASAARSRDTSAVAKQKEAEMAIWRRRSKYDPMKAAAEDRKKKEEAKRLTTAKGETDTVPFSRPSRSTYRRGYF